MFITLPLALITLSPSSQFIAGFAELIILPQSPSFSTSPPSSAVSVVSQTHSSYGPCGTLGLCYILPYKQPNRHPQHARNFPLSFYLLCIFFTHKDGTDFWVQISENQHLLVFVGITILFSTKQHRLYQATVYRQFGQDCYSGQRQFSQRGERMGLSYISECCVGRERSLGPN